MTATEENERAVGGDPQVVAPRKEQRLSPRRIAPVAYAIGAAGLALASSIVALVFTMWPSLKPDPRERLGGDVAIYAVEPGVRYGDWLRRTSKDAAALRQREDAYLGRAALPGEPLTSQARRALLAVEGSGVYVRLTIEGFKRRNVKLQWSMHDARTRERVRPADFHDQAAADLDLDTPADRSVILLWVPPPPGPPKAFVRVELRTTDGAILAVSDSAAFRGP